MKVDFLKRSLAMLMVLVLMLGALPLPEGEWTVYINGEKAGTEALGVVGGTVTVDAISGMVLVKTSDTVPEPTEHDSEEEAIDAIGGADGPTAVFVAGNWGGLVAIVAACIAAGVAVFMALKKRKKN